MVAVTSILDSLHMRRTGADRYEATNVPTGHPVVFGGQLLAQSIVAALQGHEGKTVKTLHTVFVRAASPEAVVEIEVDPMHAGRAMASSTVTISQGGRICARSIVLMSADEPDVIRHAEPAPDLPSPDAGPDGEDWVVQIDGDVDLSDPDQVGPPELNVFTAFPGAPSDLGVNQALLAFATDSFLIGTAMRPHEGIGQSQAHVTLSTGVLSHTITFHEPVSVSQWLLLVHQSTYAGRGRSHGRANVFAPDGGLVASFVQDSMIRPMSERPAGSL